MTIREQAWAALSSSQQTAIDVAEAGLRQVLEGLTVELDLAAAVSDRQGRITYVFTDGDVHLAVMDRGGWEVRVVAADGSGWSELSPRVTSLGQVSGFAPPLRDPGAPAPPDFEFGVLYPAGTVVAHVGRVWKAVVDMNGAWEPGAPGIYDNIWVEVPA